MPAPLMIRTSREGAGWAEQGALPSLVVEIAINPISRRSWASLTVVRVVGIAVAMVPPKSATYSDVFVQMRPPMMWPW